MNWSQGYEQKMRGEALHGDSQSLRNGVTTGKLMENYSTLNIKFKKFYAKVKTEKGKLLTPCYILYCKAS